MARLNVTGSTLTEKLNSLISIVGRMQQLQQGRGFLAAPAILPLSCMVKDPLKEVGLIDYFFPVAGRITKLVSNMSGARTATVEIALFNDGAKQAKTISFGDGVREVQVDLEVNPGAFLEVSLIDRSPDNASIERLGVGIVFDVTIAKERMKKITYEQLGLEE